MIKAAAAARVGYELMREEHEGLGTDAKNLPIVPTYESLADSFGAAAGMSFNHQSIMYHANIFCK